MFPERTLKDLAGSVAIVTGASRRIGIGPAICRELAFRGADVCFTHWGAYDTLVHSGRDDDGPALLREQLAALGVRSADCEADLTDPDEPGRVLAFATEHLGPPSILVNNATHSTNDGYLALDAATIDAHCAVNLRGTMMLSVLFARQFLTGSGGRIINLTSGQDRGPMVGELAYSTTKAGISSFSRTLAAEIAHLGITVNAVNPGPTDTGWMTDEWKRELTTRSPMGRLGQPDDVARLIGWLASPDADWVTGQIIHSDGGFR